MGDGDHEMADGWEAARAGLPFDPNQSPAWRDGHNSFTRVVVRFPRAFAPPKPVVASVNTATVRRVSLLEILTRKAFGVTP